MTQAAAVVVPASVSPVTQKGFFEMIGDGFAGAGKWIADAATKVWNSIKWFFETCGNFISKHQEGFIWGAIALAIGVGVTMLFNAILGGGSGNNPSPGAGA